MKYLSLRVLIKKNIVLFILLIICYSFVADKQDDYTRGFEAIESGNNPKAIYYLDRALIQNPLSDSASSLIAYAYYLLGKVDKAIQYSNNSLSLNNKNAFAYYVRGISVAALDVGTDSLYKVIKKHRKDSLWLSKNIFNRYYWASPPTYTFYGIYDYSKAIADLDKSIAFDSTYSEAFAYRALFGERISQFEQAEQDYDKSIELAPNNLNYYLSRGMFYEYRHRYRLAIKDYTKGIAIDSTFGQCYEKRGKLYAKAYFDKEYACKDLRKATMLGLYIENLKDYCTLTFIDSTTRFFGNRRLWRHDRRGTGCVCPKIEFNPERDTIKEIDMGGHKMKIMDIKDSEKTIWEFEDGRIIEISKETKKRWLKEQEKKDAL